MENNININNIFKNKIKPNLINYSSDELKFIINNYFIINKKLLENTINLENMTRIELELEIIKLWKNYPISNNDFEIINCTICLNPITNSDNLLLRCNHLLHSSCYFNYLFTNFIEINNKTNKLTNFFRCPECRNYLTENIQTYNENSNNQTELETYGFVNYENIVILQNETNNYEYDSDLNLDINLISGLWESNTRISNNNSINYISSDSDSDSDTNTNTDIDPEPNFNSELNYDSDIEL